MPTSSYSQASRRSLPVRLALDFVSLASGEIAARFAGFLAFAYLARVLAPEAYGAVELAVTVTTLFLWVVDFGLAPVAIRAVAGDGSRRTTLAGLVPAIRLLLVAVSLLALGLIVLAMNQPAATSQLVLLFALALPTMIPRQRWLLQLGGRMGAVSLAPLVRMAVFLVGVLVCVNASEHLLRVGYVEIVAHVFTMLYFLWTQRVIAPIRLRFDLSEMREVVVEAMPIALSRVCWGVTLAVPVALMATLAPPAELGLFGGARRVVVSVLTFAGLYHFNLFPSMARASNQDTRSLETLLGNSFSVAAWLGITGALLITILSEPFCILAFGARFAAAAPLLAVLIWVVPIRLLSGHARNALVALGRQRLELVTNVIGAVATVLACLVLIPALGAKGAAFAMVGACLLQWIVADRLARPLVGRLPAIAAMVRPLSLALVAGAFAWTVLPTSPWLGGLLAAVVMLLGAPLLEPGIVRELHDVIKREAQTETLLPDTPED